MGWADFAIRDPGLNAGYRRGRCGAQVDTLHFTVGVDSRALIRNRGLAQWLIPKAGAPYQFAEDDAACSHACEWNLLGDGIELERMGWHEPPTESQLYWMGRIVRWRAERRGIPLDHWPTTAGRLPIGSGFRGFADHGGLTHRACDQHTDGWTEQEWRACLAATGTTTTTEDESMMIWHATNIAGSESAFLVDGGYVVREFTGPPGAYMLPTDALAFTAAHGHVKYVEVTWPEIDAAKARTANAAVKPVGGGQAIDLEALAALVAARVKADTDAAVGGLSTWLARFFRAGWPRKAERGQVP